MRISTKECYRLRYTSCWNLFSLSRAELNSEQASSKRATQCSLWNSLCVRIKACRGLVGQAKTSHHSGARPPYLPPTFTTLSLSLSLLRAHITRSEISAVQALPTELRSSSPRVPCQANLYKNTSSKRESAAEGRVGVFKETTQPKSHKWKREKVSLLLAYIIFFCPNLYSISFSRLTHRFSSRILYTLVFLFSLVLSFILPISSLYQTKPAAGAHTHTDWNNSLDSTEGNIDYNLQRAYILHHLVQKIKTSNTFSSFWKNL